MSVIVRNLLWTSTLSSTPSLMYTTYLQWAVGQCQLESVSLLPVDGAISELPARFVDPAIGGAAAWNMLM